MGLINKSVDSIRVKVSRVNESPSTRSISEGQIMT